MFVGGSNEDVKRFTFWKHDSEFAKFKMISARGWNNNLNLDDTIYILSGANIWNCEAFDTKVKAFHPLADIIGERRWFGIWGFQQNIQVIGGCKGYIAQS